MKTTIEIPDELYRRVKAKAALQGKAVREVTTRLYQDWVDGVEDEGPSSTEWLESWIRMGEQSLEGRTEGPSASEIVEQDRARLDRD